MITLTQTDWTTVKLVSDGSKHLAMPLSLRQLKAFLARHEWVSDVIRADGVKVGEYREVK